MTTDACCICSSLLDTYDAKTEKPIIPERTLDCCSRVICTRCINQNSRYNTYCPYCQISTQPSTLPQGLRDPPAYNSLDQRIPPPVETRQHDELPAYVERAPVQQLSEKQPFEDAPDVLHFVTPNDSLQSLSLAYDVPINALRRTNNIFSDNLVQARKTVLIPGEHYKGGVSLSPQPLEGEEEEAKKNKVRRWMVACKVAEYDVALLYLEQSEYHLEAAIQSYREDERWEREHPLDKDSKNKKKTTAKAAGLRRFVGATSAGEASR